MAVVAMDPVHGAIFRTHMGTVQTRDSGRGTEREFSMTLSKADRKRAEARNQKICDLWETGDYTKKDLGKKFELTSEAIRQILMKHGYETMFVTYPGEKFDAGPKKKKEEEFPYAREQNNWQEYSDIELFRAYDENPKMTISEIAERVIGCSARTLYNRLQKRRERGWVDTSLESRPRTRPTRYVSNGTGVKEKSQRETADLSKYDLQTIGKLLRDGWEEDRVAQIYGLEGVEHVGRGIRAQ